MPLGIGAVVVSTSYDAEPAVTVPGPDAPVNAGAGDARDISSHNSPTVARNPTRPENLAVSSRIDTPRFGCGLHVSFDSGATWRRTAIPVPRGEKRKCFAPDLAFGSDGTLLVSFVTLRTRANTPNAVWVARSRDGGRTISKPTKVAGQLSFQVRLAVDPARPGRAYLTWLGSSEVGVLRFVGPGQSIRLARSDDNGRTWRRPVRVNGSSHPRAVTPSPAVGPGGRLYVLYLDLGDDRLDYEGGHGGFGGPPYSGRFRLVVARSLDRGASWRESEVDDGIVPIHRFIVFFPPSPSLAVDGRSGRIYAAFHDARLGDPDVWVWSRPQDGEAWEGPTRVNDTPRRDGRWQYLPKLAVAPDGRLDAVYYDRRADARDRRNAVSLQSSFDGGRSFEPARRLSTRPSDSRVGFLSRRGLPDLGSRLGLLSDDRSAFAVWTDTRSGTVATNKQDLFRGLALFSEPARLSEPAEHVLRYGGAVLALAGLALLARWRLRSP